MLVQMRDISSVIPYPDNPRLNDAAVDAVAKSISALAGSNVRARPITSLTDEVLSGFRPFPEAPSMSDPIAPSDPLPVVAPARRDPAAPRQRWAERLVRFRAAEQTVAAFCAAEGVSGHLFIFRNRTADRVKVLYWGGHGQCLWCQRLEAGRYHFPAPAAGVELTPAQFAMILDGIDLSQVRRFKRFAAPS